MSATLGERWAQAVAAKDDVAIRQLLHPRLDFRAMTPGRVWEATGTDDVLDALHTWFDESDEIQELVSVEQGEVVDTQRVGYRLRVANEDGLHLVEQQAYLREQDGRIGFLRIMCAGYRTIDM